MASGWLTASMLDLTFKRDGDDAWVTLDLAELDFESYADPGDPELSATAISHDTVVASVGNGPSSEIWIVTFDELPG